VSSRDYSAATGIGANRAASAFPDPVGKPILYPELPRFYNLIQRITASMPRVRGEEMEVWDPLAGRLD
jgi:hypothetical protein